MILLKVIWRSLTLSLSLSLDNASILNRVKDGYLIWMSIVPHIPKGVRYTIGSRIENKFLDLLEVSYTAYFIASRSRLASSVSGIEKEKKSAKIGECIFILDILKFLVTIIWETKNISNKQYEEVATKLDEIGKILWGWKRSIDGPDKTSLLLRSKKNPA